jgi:hypothetical protein
MSWMVTLLLIDTMHDITLRWIMPLKDSVVLSLRLPAKLVKRLDALAEEELRTRVNMIHVLIQEALDHRETDT